LDAIRAVERKLLVLERAALTALIALMVFLSFLQVVLRGAFSSGLLWGDTLLRHLVLWVGFLGAAVAAAEDKQFAMDAAGRLFSGKIRSGVHGVCHGFSAAVCGLLTRAACSFIADERAAAGILFTVGSLKVPAWPFELILPIGFALLSLHYLLKTACSAAELRAR